MTLTAGPDLVEGHAHGHLTTPEFPLEGGDAIQDFDLSYATQGHLDAAGANVVVVTSSLGSNHHRLDYLIQPGRSLDPARWFTIAVDAIGNGRTSSPSTSLRQPGPRFPTFTIRDMVRSQIWLLDELGISRVRCVIGASMGGMQALEWAKLAPARVQGIVAMTPLVRTPPWTVAVNDVARFLFRAAEQGAEHAQGHALALLELLACSTPDGLADLVGDRHPNAVLQALRDERDRRQFSVADWTAQSHAYDSHDLAAGGDGLPGILRTIDVEALLVVPPLDLFNPDSSARLAADLMPQARLVTIPTVRGHLVTDGRVRAEVDAIDEAVAAFLS